MADDSIHFRQLSFDELKPGPVPPQIEREGFHPVLLENITQPLLAQAVTEQAPKNFSVNLPRASGIVLHITSLPGRFGIGDMGSEAYRFVDYLAEAGQKVWQVLPLGPTGQDNSPYQCYSVFAGNPLLISYEKLIRQQLIDPTELHQLPLLPSSVVDYEAVKLFKLPLLKKSYRLFKKQADPLHRKRFRAFCRRNAFWLDDYALFMSLKEVNEGAPWHAWSPAIRKREPQALAHWRRGLVNEISCHKYEQYIFFRQWYALKNYCHRSGIKLMGDVPIYVALDSADVWAHQDLFNLDENGRPLVVAGVPPDYFSSTGQLWGNPLYRWDVMAQDGFGWWLSRIGAMHRMVDIVRLDHFRGFEKYWEIPAVEGTAVHGSWVKGPAEKLLQAIANEYSDISLVAEDLGFITPEVTALRDKFNLPGLRVLQFAFSSGKAEDYAFKAYPSNSVVYTGTHDNDTVVGWFRGTSANTTQTQAQFDEERRCVLNCTGTDGADINWDFIRLALTSGANLVMIPLQDVLGLGSDARMNVPGTSTGNWQWRYNIGMLNAEAAQKLKALVHQNGR